MDADLFAKILATGGDTGISTPTAKEPAKQKNATSPTSSDPFASLFAEQPEDSAFIDALSAQGNGSFEKTQQQAKQQTFQQDRQRMQQMLPQGQQGGMLGGFACPFHGGAGMFGPGGAAGGSANGELPKALVQKWTKLVQQMFDRDGYPPAFARAEIQRMLSEYQMVPQPMGATLIQQAINFGEQELGSGKPGKSGGFPSKKRGFPGMGGGFPDMGGGFPGMGGGFPGMGGGFPGMGGGFMGGGF